MCGIFGIVVHNGEIIPEISRLEETARLIEHRGPDSFGVYSESGIGLVNTRLSLLDLSRRSDQPFWDRQGRYGLVYNGEIYNFRELRADLERRGVRFRTTSDTEVLLECLLNDGVERTLPKLEGMFAFGMYDKVEKVLILVRDRFGIKPLFIYDHDDAFIFSSEIQAMRPWIKFTPDLLSMSSFLLGFHGPTKGFTFFENIKFLDPGAIVTVRTGKRTHYSTFSSTLDLWDPEQARESRSLKPHQLVDRVEEHLLGSVKKQLVADAPVGALCSGGVDSALITAMAAKFHNNLQIFHANVVGPHSEYDAAVRVAKNLRLDLKVAEMRDEDFIELLPEATRHYGHPLYIVPHSIPFLMVSRLVQREGVKAVLTGEGSDECFLGYHVLVPNIRRWRPYTYDLLKTVVRKLLGRGRAQKNGQTEWDTYGGREVYLSPERLIMGLQNRFESALETLDIREKVLRHSPEATLQMENWKCLDLINYNLRALLHRNDSMGMAASVESRFPYLDSHLVKLAVNAPYDRKIRFSMTAFDRNHYFYRDKWMLRKVAERYLPKEISYRSKGYFYVDTVEYLKISPRFFEKAFIGEVYGLSSRQTSYLGENAGNDLKLRMMYLDTWARVCLYNLPKEQTVAKLRENVLISRA